MAAFGIPVQSFSMTGHMLGYRDNFVILSLNSRSILRTVHLKSSRLSGAITVQRFIQYLRSALKLLLFSKGLPLTVCLCGFVIATEAQAGALERLFAPKAEPWSFWSKHDASSTKSIDHADWDRFLQNYVQRGDDGINRVSYARVTDSDKKSLQQYIDRLEQLPIRSYHRNAQLAYWINLYNAVTVQVILQHYPVQSIQEINISPGFFAVGPWGKKLLTIEGQAVSLNDIEHRILRPFWHDPRLHYALNCASLGCPNLNTIAYSAATVDAVLEQAAYDFINHPRGALIKDGKLYVSSIYSWFQDDFGGTEAGVIAHLKQYAKPELAKQLTTITTIADDDYDWALNDSHPTQQDDESE